MSFCLQVYTSKFPIYQSFQSCDPKESSCQAGNEYKHSSHWSVCGPPRCKQITQPEQTYKVPVPDPNRDRVKYYLAHLPDFEMSLMLERCSVYISFQKRNHTTMPGIPMDAQGRGLRGRGHVLQYAANLAMA